MHIQLEELRFDSIGSECKTRTYGKNYKALDSSSA